MGRSLLAARLADVRDAVITVPSVDGWRRCAWIYVAFLACAVPLGIGSGLLQVTVAPLTPLAAALAALTLLLHPAMTEEIVFRALLLPRRPAGGGRLRLAAAIVVALFLYVIAHPLNARFFWPAALAVFTSPSYLALAMLLGIACTAAYLVSGSIWPPVLIHWVTVAVWILLLGGQALLGPRP